jgi:hypothetical protein
MLLLHQCREKRSLELVARQPDRGFNPLLICLSHPALIKWSLGVVSRHGLPVIDRLLYC